MFFFMLVKAKLPNLIPAKFPSYTVLCFHLKTHLLVVAAGAVQVPEAASALIPDLILLAAGPGESVGQAQSLDSFLAHSPDQFPIEADVLIQNLADQLVDLVQFPEKLVDPVLQLPEQLVDPVPQLVDLVLQLVDQVLQHPEQFVDLVLQSEHFVDLVLQPEHFVDLHVVLQIPEQLVDLVLQWPEQLFDLVLQWPEQLVDLVLQWPEQLVDLVLQRPEQLVDQVLQIPEQ